MVIRLIVLIHQFTAVFFRLTESNLGVMALTNQLCIINQPVTY
ncbi:hypothetical protein [Spirosoma sp. KCTC 42546]|nr:hypothetical protein [Spirosoma sp. KCTC 42546]